MESKPSGKAHDYMVCTPPSREGDRWRQKCGCLKTSEKLKELLKCFPAPPPPTPISCGNECETAYCNPTPPPARAPQSLKNEVTIKQLAVEDEPLKTQLNSKLWQVVFDLVQLVQLSVTATALALYYLIYCYMQLVYYTLRSALYFHQADGPMKITIGVVTLTSLVVGFNILIRMEKLIGIF